MAAINDHIIDLLLEDDRYNVLCSGEIHTVITVAGNLSVKGIWRRCDSVSYSKHREVSYTVDGVRYRLLAHRIIYAKYLKITGAKGLTPECKVYHLNGDKRDNNINNLKIGTQADVNLHRFQGLGHAPVIGNHKLNVEDIKDIRTKAESGMKFSVIGQHYDISKGHVSDIVHKKIWKNV
jgi:hypothetical protein